MTYARVIKLHKSNRIFHVNVHSFSTRNRSQGLVVINTDFCLLFTVCVSYDPVAGK